MASDDIHNRQDVRDLPLYSVGEAARYIRIAPATLRSWVAGRTYPVADGSASFEPLISTPEVDDPVRLSFNNLVEAHVLRALRLHHGVTIASVRTAIEFAESKLGINRLLIDGGLQTSAGELFVEKYGQLINLSKSGQLALKKLLAAYLSRIDWDDQDLPIRLYPFIAANIGVGAADRSVVIDPEVSFGRPTISNKGISTSVLAGRIDAGESIELISRDFHLEKEEVEAALLYEMAA